MSSSKGENISYMAPKHSQCDPLIITRPDGGTFSLDYTFLKRAALTLRALNHPLRRNILQLVETQKRVTVTEIYVSMRIEQSVASQHLALLRRAGFLSTEREGKFIYYTINKKRLEEITQVVNEIAQPE